MDGECKQDLTDFEIEKVIEFQKRLNDIMKKPGDGMDEFLITEQIIRVLRYKEFDVDAAFGVLMKSLGLRFFDEIEKVPYEAYKRVYDSKLVLILKKRAPDGSKIIWIRHQNWNVNEMDVMTYLASIYHYVDEALYSEKTQKYGVSLIVDSAGTGYVTLAKILSFYTIDLLRQILSFSQGGYPIRNKAMFFINTPWILTKFCRGVKYLMSKKIGDRLHLHHKGAEILLDYNFVKEDLPVSLNGSIPDEDALDLKLLQALNKKGTSGDPCFLNCKKYFKTPNDH